MRITWSLQVIKGLGNGTGYFFSFTVFSADVFMVPDMKKSICEKFGNFHYDNESENFL